MKTKIATQVIHEGYTPEPLAGCVAPPLYLSSTFAQDGVGGHKGYEYARTNNPTREMLEKNIAALEGAFGACGFATGMAAISNLMLMFKPKDHIIVSSNVYGGTYRVFANVFCKFQLEYSFIDTTSLENIKKHIQPNTKLLFLETPTNPILHITDLKTTCDFAHEKNIKVCVDNTFMTPILQKPMDLGADYVIHSATKYLGGHSDVLGGLLCIQNETDYTTLKYIQNAAGCVLSPFDSWLILRGIKTLNLRMKAHCENAQKICDFLISHPNTGQIYYPGLKTHPNHEIACKQTKGHGGMISFEIKKGSVDLFLKNLKIFTLAESLGAVESLVCIPAKMTHAAVPAEERTKLGITDTLIRLSVGVEDVEDLIQDLDFALKNCQ